MAAHNLPWEVCREAFELWESNGRNGAVAARAAGLDRCTFMHRVRKWQGRVSQGYDPDHGLTHTLPEGLELSKVSSYYNADGELTAQWVQAKPEHRYLAHAIDKALTGLDYTPAPVIKPPKESLSDLLTLYTLTDYHIGMYAWDKETGDDWDTDIAAKVMLSAITEMLDGSPASQEAILNLQGDFQHWDGLEAVTPTNRHILDADTRFDRMIEVSLQLTMQAIEMLLKKHKRVKLLVCEGNHDIAGSAWLRKSMKLIWRKNKRVEVDDTPFPFYGHLHGETMLAFHHGHKVKNAKLPSLFASEPRYRAMWGQAAYTYIHTGHYHHAEQQMDEMGGAIVERHPTLAGRDAHAARGGYVGRRAAHAITYHKTRGEVSRKSVVPA